MDRRSQMDLIEPDDPLETLRRCGGYYKCPPGPNGLLVGYAGRYPNPIIGESELQKVGFTYYNCARYEAHPLVLGHLVDGLAGKLEESKVGLEFDLVLGAPMGGIAMAFALALNLGKEFAFAEKKVTKVATGLRREVSELVIGRHDIEPGTRVLIGDDVVNNFSTTMELIRLLRALRAEVVGITCLINRSQNAEWKYKGDDLGEVIQMSPLPVVGLLEIPTEQYLQHDPMVAEYIATNRVVWSPKKQWNRLQETMAAA